jgi:hypothetical protein
MQTVSGIVNVKFRLRYCIDARSHVQGMNLEGLMWIHAIWESQDRNLMCNKLPQDKPSGTSTSILYKSEWAFIKCTSHNFNFFFSGTRSPTQVLTASTTVLQRFLTQCLGLSALNISYFLCTPLQVMRHCSDGRKQTSRFSTWVNYQSYHSPIS